MVFFYLFGLHEWLFSFRFSSYNDCAILIPFTCASCPFSHLIPTDFSSLVMYCESASDEAYQSVIVSTFPLLYQNIFLSILFPCVVGIAAGYELLGPGIKSRWVEIFHTRRKRAGTHPASSLLYIGDRLIPGGESAGGVVPTLDKEQSSTFAPFTPVSWLQVTGCNILYFGRQCFTAIQTAYVYHSFFLCVLDRRQQDSSLRIDWSQAISDVSISIFTDKDHTKNFKVNLTKFFPLTLAVNSLFSEVYRKDNSSFCNHPLQWDWATVVLKCRKFTAFILPIWNWELVTLISFQRDRSVIYQPNIYFL